MGMTKGTTVCNTCGIHLYRYTLLYPWSSCIEEMCVRLTTKAQWTKCGFHNTDQFKFKVKSKTKVSPLLRIPANDFPF